MKKLYKYIYAYDLLQFKFKFFLNLHVLFIKNIRFFFIQFFFNFLCVDCIN